MPGERADAGVIGYEGAVGVGTERVEDFRCGDRVGVGGTRRRPVTTVPRGTRKLQIARRQVDRQRVLCDLQNQRCRERCMAWRNRRGRGAMAGRRLHRGADVRQNTKHGDSSRDHSVDLARNKAVMCSLQGSSPFGGVYLAFAVGISLTSSNINARCRIGVRNSRRLAGL